MTSGQGWKIYPATFNQEMRSATQARSPSRKSNEFFAISLSGQIQPSALEAALRVVVERHEALRTDFPIIDGQRVQRVRPKIDVGLRYYDFSTADIELARRAVGEASARECADTFDVESAPLLRGVLFRLAPKHHIFAVVCDHLIIDGWSMNIFWNDFLAAYRAQSLKIEPHLAPVTRQFGEYALWQRDRLSGSRLAELQDFWRSKLSHPPAPIGWQGVQVRPSPFSYRSAVLQWVVSARELATMKQAAAKDGASLFSLFNAMFARSLRSIGAREEILVHTPSANRRNAEFNGTVGYVANGIILRVPVQAGSPFGEDLAAHALAARQGYAYGEFPLTLTREFVGSRLDDTYGYRTQVSHHHYSFFRLPDIDIPGLECAPAMVLLDDVLTLWPYDLALCSYVLADSAVLKLWYNTDLFDRSVAQTALGEMQADVERSLVKLASTAA